MTRALQFGDLLALGDESSVLRQTVAEHVGEQNHVRFLTDLTDRVRGLAQVLRGADEFRVRVAHRVPVDATTLELVDETATREPVVDDADITAQHVDGETHGLTRYF